MPRPTSRDDLSITIRNSVEVADAFNAERMERVAMLYTPSRKLRAKHEARRHAARQCKACYYLRPAALALQGFTDYVCRICDQDQRHHNSNVPKYCPGCCATHQLCGTCGGSILQ